jgi:hypothetical protein
MKTMCDHCNKKEAVHLDELDPFTVEIYPEELDETDISNWCEDCYHERLMDI